MQLGKEKEASRKKERKAAKGEKKSHRASGAVLAKKHRMEKIPISSQDRKCGKSCPGRAKRENT